MLFVCSPPKNRLVSGSIPDRGRACVHVFIRFAECVMFGVHLGGIGSGMATEWHRKAPVRARNDKKDGRWAHGDLPGCWEAGELYPRT